MAHLSVCKTLHILATFLQNLLLLTSMRRVQLRLGRRLDSARTSSLTKGHAYLSDRRCCRGDPEAPQPSPSLDCVAGPLSN